MGRARLACLCFVLTFFCAGSAAAACFAEYKARRDNPLRLHYGIVQLSDAECASPQAAVARRIAAGGWTLLAVTGLLSEAEAAQRRADAGEFYLRY